MLVLSLFPGIDLLGRGFEIEGYCVVRGPDLLWGGDIRGFHPPAGRFDGVIGGPPCQDFSSLRRCEPSGNGLAMLAEYVRCVEAARPIWFLLENVPGVPDVAPVGYRVQRFDLRANECGLTQRRLRHFQFGSNADEVLLLNRDERRLVTEKAATAIEGTQRERRGWSEFCVSQGLPADFDLPGMTLEAKYRAVGNGVPVPMARFVARAIRDARYPAELITLCVCGCGRSVPPERQHALAACRKRMQRRRDAVQGGGTRGDTATHMRSRAA
jgi:DNA (cytosine-5)-methyltransferase 1